MKSRMLKLFLPVLMCITSFSVSYAQKDSLKGVVNVVGSYIPELKIREKYFEQPRITDTFKTEIRPEYSITLRNLSFPYQPDTLSAARMKSEPLKRLRRFYIKIGFGNYLSPLGEARFNSLRSKNQAYDISYRYFSSAGNISRVGFPGIADHTAAANYRRIFKNHTLDLQARYGNNKTHYYGYNALDTLNDSITKSSIRQTYNFAGISLRFANKNLYDSNRIITDGGIAYYFLRDRLGSTENNLRFDLSLSRYVKEFYVGGRLLADYYHNNMKGDPGAVNNINLQVNPFVRLLKPRWNAEIGAVLAGSAGTYGKFYIYPNLNAAFHLYDKYLILFATVGGGLDRNSFDVLRRNNPFIISNPNIRNTSRQIDASLGLRGSLSRDFSYRIYGGYALANDQSFFVTDSTRKTGNYFNMLYSRLQTIKAGGELNYQFGEKASARLRGNYYYFMTGSELKAWHMPSFDIALSGFYNLSDKFIFKLDVFYIGNQWAPDYQSGVVVPVKIKGTVDVNLSVEYRYNKWLSLFVTGNNLAAFRYNRWFRYPTQQVNVIGGLTFSF